MQRKMIEQDGHLVDLLYVDNRQMQGVLDHCAALRDHGITGTDEVRHLATIPAELVEKYINDAGITFREFMTNPEHQTRMLNDPALAGFRIHQGRVA